MSDSESGIDELRKLVNMANNTAEGAFDDFGLYEVVELLRACRRIDLDITPEQLTRDEAEFAARRGRVSIKCLRRLYKQEGLSETGPDWEGRD